MGRISNNTLVPMSKCINEYGGILLYYSTNFFLHPIYVSEYVLTIYDIKAVDIATPSIHIIVVMSVYN